MGGDGIKLLPYSDDFMFMKRRFRQCARMTRRVEGDFVRAGLRINEPKCHTGMVQQRRQLGFDVDLAKGKFQVPLDRWEALKVSVVALLSSKHGRV